MKLRLLAKMPIHFILVRATSLLGVAENLQQSRQTTNHLKQNTNNHNSLKQQNTMKKQVKKITLKTDKIVNLSNTQAMNVKAGRAPECPTSRKDDKTYYSCPGY